jgi:thiol-disulfide isomerase/thioredoxin
MRCARFIAGSHSASGAFYFHVMRSLTIILSLVFTAGLLADEPSTLQSVAAEVTAAARQEALEKILSERGSAEDFERAIAAARAAGIGGQAILEARFLYQVDKDDDAAIAAMLPDFLKQREAFKIEDSAIFSVQEEWLAVVEYVHAIAALIEGDKEDFKKHITEAFWLNPEQAAAFAPHIERMRMKDSMADVVIDFTLKPSPLAGGEPAALSAFIKEKKAVLLHFWSPWSRECVDAMPDFIATAEPLEKNGIAVISMVQAGMPGLIEEAALMVRPYVDKHVGAWLIDPKIESLARQLRVRKLPTMVIISKEGKVLFNGEPADEKFWETLHHIDARIMRPASIGNAR